MTHMSLSTPRFFAGKREGMTLVGVDEAILNRFIALLIVYSSGNEVFGWKPQSGSIFGLFGYLPFAT